MSEVRRRTLVDVAMGHEPADSVIVNGKVVDVNTGTIRQEGVAIKGERIAAVGDITYTQGPETIVINAQGSYLVPGLVDPHLHQWHTYTNSTVFAAANLLHGTTAVADGFYGHAIVTGAKSVRFFLDELSDTPVKPLFLVPTLCYTQNRYLGLPNSPNAPTINELIEMLDWPEARGIEETGYDLLLDPARRDSALFDLFEAALERDKVITGHGAALPDDRAVNAFLASGVMNNHELVTAKEARRQAELGMISLIREGASCENTGAVAKAVTEDAVNSRAFNLCPDVVTTEALFDVGQQDECIRVAVRNGIPPITAIQMSTIQPAEFFRVNHDMGVIAAGRLADIVFVSDLVNFTIDRVIADGQVCVERGELVWSAHQPNYPEYMYDTIRVDRKFTPEEFQVRVSTENRKARVRTIVVQDGFLESEEDFVDLDVEDGIIRTSGSDKTINRIAMIDRIHGTGEIGVGFVRGFDLSDGAIGTSANVFNQNIVVVGASERDMAVAANEIVKMRGGFVAVREGQVVASFPTPLNGLVADLSVAETRRAIDELIAAWREMGCRLKTPQINLEFVTLVTIPRLRISTKGLVVIEGDSYRFVDTVV
jgi:adenine deaminase